MPPCVETLRRTYNEAAARELLPIGLFRPKIRPAMVRMQSHERLTVFAHRSEKRVYQNRRLDIAQIVMQRSGYMTCQVDL